MSRWGNKLLSWPTVGKGPVPDGMGNPALKLREKIVAVFGIFFLCSIQLFTCKNDCVQWIRTPQFDEVDRITEPETWMTTKYHTRLTKVGAKSFRIDVFKMFETGVLHETYIDNQPKKFNSCN